MSSDSAEHFNPRAREGRDPTLPCFHPGYQYFNPRAREGRDQYNYRFLKTIDYFNPRAREGRDLTSRKRQNYWQKFQSTRP